MDAKYFHLVVEVEASETSEGFKSFIRSYDDVEYSGILLDKGYVLADAAIAASNSENQVCF